MKKILVPVDFSVKSGYATKLAAKIAKQTDSIVYLLHMVELPSGQVDMGSGTSFSIPKSMLYLQKVKEKLIQIKTGFDSEITVKYSILFKSPHVGITEFSQKIGADLIIMGSKGTNDLDEILVGSTTERITRTSKIPVLVVKNEDQDFRIKELVFASDFEEESKKSFELFLDFAKKFESQIHFLKINTAQKFENTNSTKASIENFLKDFDVPKYTICVYNDSTIEKGITNYSKDIDADLIAITTHRRGWLSRYFNGSISKNLTQKVLRPVLTFLV